MLPVFPLPHSDLLVILAKKWAEYVRRIDGAEGGSRTHMTLRSTDFKNVGGGITKSYETI